MTLRALFAAAALGALAFPAGAAAGSLPANGAETLATGLDNPRGIALGRDGTVYVAEAGRGGAGPCLERPDAPPACLGATGAITAVKDGKARRILTGLPSLAPADGTSAAGPADVARRGARLFALLGLGARPSARDALGPLGARLGWVVEARDGQARPLADLAGPHGDAVSDPFGLTNVGRQLYAADPAAGSVMVVQRDGDVRTKLATPYPSAVGAAGKRRLYVTEMTAHPFPVEAARVLRVGGGGATPTVFGARFTHIVDVVPAPYGSLYVLEGTQGAEAGRSSGRILHMEPGGAIRHILATGLAAPGGLAVDRAGRIYVTLDADRPGSGMLVRLPGHGSHASVGTPQGYYPDMGKATKRGLAEANAVWKGVLRNAPRFTYEKARKAGYRLTSPDGEITEPGVFHLRRDRFDRDGHEMDPRRPESLVYYKTSDGRRVLLAFMYRAESQSFPPVTRGLLGWHRHGTTTKALPMTHVWRTGDVVSAVANCLPVAELEAALPWKFEGSVMNTGPESLPCLPRGERPPGQ